MGCFSKIPIVGKYLERPGDILKNPGQALMDAAGVAGMLATGGAISPIGGTLGELMPFLSGGLSGGSSGGKGGLGDILSALTGGLTGNNKGGGASGNPQIEALRSALAMQLLQGGGLNALLANPDDGKMDALRGELAKLPGMIDQYKGYSGITDSSDPYENTQVQNEKLNQEIALKGQQKQQAEMQLRKALSARGIPAHVIDTTIQRSMQPYDQDIASYRTTYNENMRKDRQQAVQNMFGMQMNTGQTQAGEDQRSVENRANQQRNLSSLYGFLMAQNGQGGQGSYQFPSYSSPTQANHGGTGEVPREMPWTGGGWGNTGSGDAGGEVGGILDPSNQWGTDVPADSYGQQRIASTRAPQQLGAPGFQQDITQGMSDFDKAFYRLLHPQMPQQQATQQATQQIQARPATNVTPQSTVAPAVNPMAGTALQDWANPQKRVDMTYRRKPKKVTANA